MLRALVLAFVVSVVLAAAVGLAATLGGLTSPDLFATSVAVDNDCDTVFDLTINPDNPTATNVTTVRVNNILDACIGNTLVVQLLENNTGTVIAAKSRLVPDGALDDNQTVVAPRDNCDEPDGNFVAVADVDVPATRVLITSGTVPCGASLVVTMTP